MIDAILAPDRHRRARRALGEGSGGETRRPPGGEGRGTQRGGGAMGLLCPEGRCLRAQRGGAVRRAEREGSEPGGGGRGVRVVGV